MSAHKRDPADNLTNGERIFCYAYLLNGNQREAAKKGFKCKTNAIADMTGWRVLQKPQVLHFISKARQDIMGSTAAVCEQAREVINELAILSFSDPRKYVDALNLPEETKKAIKKLGPEAKAISDIDVNEYVTTTGETTVTTRKISFKFHSKTQALNMLGKHHKLYAEIAHSPLDGRAPGTYELPNNGMGPQPK